MPEAVPTRREYDTPGMEVQDLNADPMIQFTQWLSEAVAADLPEPYAMNLATTSGLQPSVRTVLLRGIDSGIVFYTNYSSRKGSELAMNPRAAVNVTWLDLHRQVRFEGSVAKVEATLSDEYFASRPRGAQVAARASRQSEVMANRSVLEERVAAEETRFEGAVPRPEHWGGYRLLPDMLEFWQGRRNRMHDRIRYRRVDDDWRIERLSP